MHNVSTCINLHGSLLLGCMQIRTTRNDVHVLQCPAYNQNLLLTITLHESDNNQKPRIPYIGLHRLASKKQHCTICVILYQVEGTR